MIKHVAINHPIQTHIVQQLQYMEAARFRDLRPPKTDTNLYSYHLKLLVQRDIIEKCPSGYTLTAFGMNYVDRVSGVRTQPKIITMLVIQNDEGDILLQKRLKQPYINTWTLPYGKVHIGDSSLEIAARRQLAEKVGLDDMKPEPAGDCYIRVWHSDQILSSTLVHVFRLYADDITQTETLQWARPHKINSLRLAPAVSQIMTRTFFKDDFFFEEFNVDW